MNIYINVVNISGAKIHLKTTNDNPYVSYVDCQLFQKSFQITDRSRNIGQPAGKAKFESKAPFVRHRLAEGEALRLKILTK